MTEELRNEINEIYPHVVAAIKFRKRIIDRIGSYVDMERAQMLAIRPL